MSRSPWTTEEDRQLRKLAQAGLSLTEIAREVGRNQSSVRVRAIKLDIAIARDLNGMQKRKLRERPSDSVTVTARLRVTVGYVVTLRSAPL